MRVAITGAIPDAGVQLLREQHDVVVHDADTPITRDALLRHVAGADAIVSLLTERIDDELLDAAGPQLRVVANVAVGYNNIDVEACRARGVPATNTPGVLTDATADIAMALILLGSYRTYFRQMLEFRWRQWLTTKYLHDWLGDRAFYRIERDHLADNPDQRVSVDLQALDQFRGERR